MSALAPIDEDRLQQVLTNLIVNAVQAMPDSGVLRVGVVRAVVSPPGTASTAPQPCVRIDVGDSGPGIAAEARPHIFEPFFTTKAPADGTGLGLAVVDGIVADHHGWIAVDSSARGTVFSIFFHEAQA